MPNQRQAFVVRLWDEGDTPQSSQLRGSIQVVKTGEIRYFTALDQIPKILRGIHSPDEHFVDDHVLNDEADDLLGGTSEP